MTAVVKALVAARQKCLTDDEAYWDPRPDFTRPVSARNEAAALSWLLDHQAVVCRGGPSDVEELRALCAEYCGRLGVPEPPEQQRLAGADQRLAGADQRLAGADQRLAGADQPAEGAAGAGTGAEEASTSGRSFEEASAEAALHRWCTEKGVKGAASPALFGVVPSGGPRSAGEGPPPLRGLRADSPVAPGDIVLHVPADLLISYETAKESDLGKVLVRMPLGLADDSIALIWTCMERREPEALHAAFWAALPDRFATLLSATDADVALLEGTPLHREAVEARQHLREAFNTSSPAFQSLLAAYPDYFKPEWFSWESYLWAVELWYSYGIQIQFSSGEIRTCLAPYLGLMNHHPLPHVVHFSKVDPQTGCLRVRAFRPCDTGRQLFLSYGPYPNGKLLLFYGFAIPDNPVDEVDVTLLVPAGPTATDRRALLTAASLSLEHRIRAGGRWAPPLLQCARLLTAAPEQLRQMRLLPPAELKARLAAPAEAAAKAAALRLIGAAVEALLRPAEACEARLRAAAGSERAAERVDQDGDGAQAAVVAARESEELRHFAQVYVAGVVRILREVLGAVRAEGEAGPS